MSSKFPRCGNSLYFNLLESNLIQSYVSKPIIHNCRYFQSLIVHVCALILPNVLCVLQWMVFATGMNQAVSVCVQRNHSKYVKMDTYLIFSRPAGKHVKIFALIFNDILIPLILDIHSSYLCHHPANSIIPVSYISTLII